MGGIRRRNETEKEISRVVNKNYAYGTDFPGRIARELYDLGYRKVSAEELTS